MQIEELQRLHFYQTSPHPCSYLEGLEARTIFLDPAVPVSRALYSRLVTVGFRRSGAHLYRPACDQCQACLSCRIRVQDFVANNEVTDADVRSAYDELKGRIGSTEYKVNHILVEDETEARALIAKLQAGEKFDELAKAHSKDPGSKDKGGELGWSNPGMYVPAFSEAMVKLGKGQMTTEPVKSNFGYHIIKVEDTRTLAAPEFDKLAPQLKQRLQAQRLEQHILELRTAAKVE